MFNMSIRRFFSEVAGNQIQIDKDWGSQCLGYNIKFVLPSQVCTQLNNIQQEILKVEPDSLYYCPGHSLHTTVAWILATRHTYSKPKDALWEEIEKGCQSELEQVSQSFPSFAVNFTDIVATNAAIIALAYDDGEMTALRQAIKKSLPIPPETENEAQIIHTTLFRYAKSLNDPRRLLGLVDGFQPEIPVVIDSLSIRKELIYPSLQSELLFSVKLR